MKKHESELIRLLKARDEQGLTLLLSQYTPLIRYIIAPILPLKEDQEECLSDVAMRVWDRVDSFDESKGQWTSWLTALVRNMALNQARKRKAAEAVEELSDTLAADTPSPEDEVLRAEKQQAITRAIRHLPQEEQLLFYRKYYYMQSTGQIAAELSMTVRAVEGKLYRLRKKLQKELGGEFHD